MLINYLLVTCYKTYVFIEIGTHPSVLLFKRPLSQSVGRIGDAQAIAFTVDDGSEEGLFWVAAS